METVIVKAFVWMCSPHTYKHCVFRNASPVCKSRSLIRPLNPAWICSYTCRPLTEPWPERTLQSPPGGQWALFSIPLLLPLPVFISLHLFWSSGVISQIKCLSAHKGRWLICFNTSICQPSCLSLHGVCERRAPRLNWHFKTYKHFNTSGRRGLQCVSVCVCVRAFVCVCVCVCVWVQIHSSSRVGFPAAWSIYHPWHHQCAVRGRKKMERCTSCKHAPSCQSAAVRLAWVTRIRKGVKKEKRGEERFVQSSNNNYLPARWEEGNQGHKFEGNVCVDRKWCCWHRSNDTTGDLLRPGLNRKSAVQKNGRPNSA